jgi:hypothetical protein
MYDPLDLFLTLQLIGPGVPSLGQLLVFDLHTKITGLSAAFTASERLGATFLRGQWHCILTVGASSGEGRYSE